MAANTPYTGPYEQLSSQLDKDGYLYSAAKLDGTSIRINMRRLLGHGHFGYVYPLQRFDQQESLYAAKILDNRQVKEKHILNERTIHGTLSRSAHPNIVHMYGHLVHQGIWAINVLEFMSGGTLERFIDRGAGPLPPWKAAIFTRQLLSGVAFIHNQGYAHRDLKLANLLLNQSQTLLKITDFGIACRHNPQQLCRGRCGTLPYIAPEVCLADYVPVGYNTQKADIWSVGIVLYYMLHQDFPWGIPREAVPLEKRFWYALFYEVLTTEQLTLHLPESDKSYKWALQLTLNLLNKNPEKRPIANWFLISKYLNEEMEMPKAPGASEGTGA